MHFQFELKSELKKAEIKIEDKGSFNSTAFEQSLKASANEVALRDCIKRLRVDLYQSHKLGSDGLPTGTCQAARSHAINVNL